MYKVGHADPATVYIIYDDDTLLLLLYFLKSLLLSHSIMKEKSSIMKIALATILLEKFIYKFVSYNFEVPDDDDDGSVCEEKRWAAKK